MKTSSLETLAANPPKNAFAAVRASAAKIAALESKLGLTPSPPIWNVSKAGSRIAQLESMVAASASAPEASEADKTLSAEIARRTAEHHAAAPAASKVAGAPVPPGVEKFGAARFCASVKIAGRKNTPVDPNSPLTGRARFAAALKIEGQN